MPNLVLGPIQRGLGITGIRIWVETDVSCTVEVLGHEAATWCVAGHHYGLVELDRLQPGTDEPYEVRLDGEVVWPEPDDDRPRPRVRTLDGDAPIRLVVGSCRQAAPPSWLDTVESERDPPGIGTDSLAALARQMIAGQYEVLDGMVLLGDQVYADEPDPRTVEAMRMRRGSPPPEGWPEVSTFEEYTWVYQEAWSEPSIRWLLAALPSVMIFDDHDVIDDWNTSVAWRREIEQQPWWQGRIEGGLMAYWLYQHIGNVGRTQRQDAGLIDEMQAVDDGEAALRAFAHRADKGTPDDVGHRWSFAVELGNSRLLVLDSRNGRILDPDDRSMLAPAEWAWLDEHMTGDLDHLFVASSVPWLLPRAIHDLEAWDDALVRGAWGGVAASRAEWLRRYIDLEHWAAFGRSFKELAELVAEVSEGRRGVPPATITALSGDVHFGYVAEAELGGESRVRQVVSSPFRQAITPFDRRAQGLAMRAPVSWVCRALVGTTPQDRPRFDWKVTDGPVFDDHLVVLIVDGRRASVAYEVAGLDDREQPTLRRIGERAL
jgi:hypothetical protein